MAEVVTVVEFSMSDIQKLILREAERLGPDMAGASAKIEIFYIDEGFEYPLGDGRFGAARVTYRKGGGGGKK